MDTKNKELNEIISFLLENNFKYQNKLPIEELKTYGIHLRKNGITFYFKLANEEVYCLIETKNHHSPIAQDKISEMKIRLINNNSFNETDKYKSYKITTLNNFKKRFDKTVPEIIQYNSEKIELENKISNRKKSAIAELNVVFQEQAKIECRFSDRVLNVEYKNFSFNFYIERFLDQDIKEITVKMQLDGKQNQKEINIIEAKQIIDLLDK